MEKKEYPFEDLVLAISTYYRIVELSELELEQGQIHPRDASISSFCQYLLDNNTQFNFPKITVTEEDYQLKDKILKWSKRLVFKALDDQASGFQKACFELASKTHAGLSSVGVLKFFPKMTLDQERKTTLLNQLKECVSEPIGVVGVQQLLKIQVIDKRWLDKIEVWAYNAITEDKQLVGWMSNKNIFEIGDIRTVTAKVKGYQMNYHIKSLLETRLNYVR